MSVVPKLVGGSIVLVILLTIILISISLHKLNSDEVGLQYDTVQRILDKTPKYEGLHNGPPGFKFIKFPSVFRSLRFTQLKCLNKDGVGTELDITYQYRVRANNLNNIVLQFQNYKGYEDVLHSIGESAIHDACSRFNTSQFQAERGAFQEDIQQTLNLKYNQISTDLTDLQVNNILRPSAYEQAVRNKEAAREDILVACDERPQALTEAETKKLEAQTQAEITVAKAHSDARILITQAAADAEGILNEYHKEADTYQSLMLNLQLGTKGLLSYLGIRALEDAPNDVNVAVKSPAKSAWFNTNIP